MDSDATLTMADALDRLPKNRWDELIRLGLAEVEEFDAGKGMERWVSLLSQIEDYLNGFQRDSPMETEVLRVVETNNTGIHQGRSYITLADVFRWMDIPLDRHHNMQMPITDVLKRYGWTLKRVSIMGKTQRIWLRPKA